MRPIQGGPTKDRALPWWRAWVKNSPAIRPHRPGPPPADAYPGVLDRASAADAAFLRLRRRGFWQHLRGADPVRRDPGAAVDLFRPAGAAPPRPSFRRPPPGAPPR